jgi:nitrogen fixation protein NifU and related proteins
MEPDRSLDAAPDLYREIMLTRARRPVLRGRIIGASAHGKGANLACPDTMEVWAVVREGALVEARFRGRGCHLSQASADLALEEAVGQTVADVLTWGEDVMLLLLGFRVPPSRLPCALLGLRTLQSGLRRPAPTRARPARPPARDAEATDA